MKHSVLLRCATVAAALTVTLAACGGAQDSSDGSTDPAPAVESSDASDSSENSTASDEGASSESAADSESEESTSGSDESDSQETDADKTDADKTDADKTDAEKSDTTAGTLSISLDGEDTELTPDIVRCNGEPGKIHNVIIKMQSDLPLVKVTPGEFAMVKMHNQGEPEKSSSTKDITAEDDTVSFDEAKIGDAVVDGSVTCLQGDDD